MEPRVEIKESIGFNWFKSAILIVTQILGIIVVSIKAKGAKAKIAGIMAILTGGEVVSYVHNRIIFKDKYGKDRHYSVKKHYKMMADSIANKLD